MRSARRQNHGRGALRDNTQQQHPSRGLRKHENIPRPSHADYPAFVKYGGANDRSGGGQFSGRLTAPLCVAGAISEQILARKGIKVAAHLSRAAGIDDTPFDPCDPDNGIFDKLKTKLFPTIDDKAGEEMTKK